MCHLAPLTLVRRPPAVQAAPELRHHQGAAQEDGGDGEALADAVDLVVHEAEVALHVGQAHVAGVGPGVGEQLREAVHLQEGEGGEVWQREDLVWLVPEEI